MVSERLRGWTSSSNENVRDFTHGWSTSSPSNDVSSDRYSKINDPSYRVGTVRGWFGARWNGNTSRARGNCDAFDPLRASAQSGIMPGRDETGASLILALIFLVVVSLIVLSMATWTSTGLNASARFTAAQSIVSTANSATEVAVQSARYNFQSSTIDASPPVPCLPSGFNTPIVPNGQSLSTWCSTQWNPLSASTRKVAFYTCLSAITTASACATRPLLLAIVTYNDFPIGGNYESCAPTTSPTPPSGVSSCGTGMVVDTWVFGAIPPQITGVLGQAIPTGCTTPQVQIDGTGFTNPASVSFVASVTVNGVTSYVSYPAPKGSVTVVNASTILACEPTSGSGTVDVVVATPTGVSQMTTADQITY